MTDLLTQLGAVYDRAATDPAFRQQLLASPSATLAAAGLDVSGLTIDAVENSAARADLLLPVKPAFVTDEEAKAAAEVPPDTSSPTAPLQRWAQLVFGSWTDSALRQRILTDAAWLAAQLETAVAPLAVVEVPANSATVTVPASGSSSIGEMATSAVMALMPS
jgi:hypothetical protein